MDGARHTDVILGNGLCTIKVVNLPCRTAHSNFPWYFQLQEQSPPKSDIFLKTWNRSTSIPKIRSRQPAANRWWEFFLVSTQLLGYSEPGAVPEPRLCGWVISLTIWSRKVQKRKTVVFLVRLEDDLWCDPALESPRHYVQNGHKLVGYG